MNGAGLDEEARRRRVFELSREAPSLEPLLVALGDSSWRVRRAAITMVQAFVDRLELIPALVAGLGDGANVGRRNACVDALLGLGEVTVDKLAAALRSDNPYQRKLVAEVLGRLHAPRAKEALVAALADPDPNVQASVAESLGGIGGADVIGRLRALLGSGLDLQTSAYVLDALSRAEAELPFTELEPWIGERTVARLVFPLLGRCVDPRAIPPLVSGLEAPARGTRHGAIRALGELLERLDAAARASIVESVGHRAAAVENVRFALGALDDWVAAAAVRLLGLLGSAEDAPRILAASCNRSFLSVGLETVRRMGPAVAPTLLARLSDLDIETRVLGLEVLGDLPGEAVRQALLSAAQAEEARIAETAIRSLGRVGGPSAVAALVEMSAGADEERAAVAAQALGNIRAEERAAVAQALRARWDDRHLSPSWVRLLGDVGDPADAPRLRASLGHPNAAVRRAAVEVTSRREDVTPVSGLVLALADESAPVRQAAAAGLGRRALQVEAAERQRVVEVLLTRLRDADPWVGVDAISALGQLGGEAATAALRQALAQEFAPAAIAALRGLLRDDPADLSELVGTAARHTDPEVVCEAVVATAGLPTKEAEALLQPLVEHPAWQVRCAAATSLLERRSRVFGRDWLIERLGLEDEALVRDALSQLLEQVEA